MIQVREVLKRKHKNQKMAICHDIAIMERTIDEGWCFEFEVRASSDSDKNYAYDKESPCISRKTLSVVSVTLHMIKEFVGHERF